MHSGIKKLFLLDMDGTIYNENSIFEGTLDFLSQIEKKWRTLYFHHQQFLQIRKGLCGKR